MNSVLRIQTRRGRLIRRREQEQQASVSSGCRLEVSGLTAFFIDGVELLSVETIVR